MLRPTKIITKRQLLFLDQVATSSLADAFYLTGGTALCGFYLPYRYSEDLDFFSPTEFDLQSVVVCLQALKGSVGFDSFELNTSFNRNLIFLHFGDAVLKTEFTFFPFEPKAGGDRYKNILVDSVEDIALNKLFVIYQNPRLRDYMDLFAILEKYQELDLGRIIADSRIKFDWHLDPLQLGKQFLRSEELKDAPRLVGDFDYAKMHLFYEKAAKDLGVEVFGG
jgi:predicted nucleotidyltransferase component of viral defense system